MEVAVIGAGIAGLACADVLARGGVHVRVFDKGRAAGGRMATRRFETPLGEARCDHGAQYFTARGAEFARVVRRLAAEGSVAEWRPRGQPAGDAWHVGVPAMTAPARAIARGVEVASGIVVARVAGAPGSYALHDEGGAELAECGGVVIATPAEQAAALLAEIAPAQAAAARASRSAPCWAVVLVFDAPVALAFDVARPAGGSLAWLARDGSKPGRSGPETWVAHLSVEASRRLLETDPADVRAAALRDLLELGFPEPVHAWAHRWRFAMVEQTSPADRLWDADRRVGACGDWRAGPRVEAAWSSGVTLAHELLASRGGITGRLLRPADRV